MDLITDDQLKGYLKKESRRLGISINNTYTTYFSKILLQRISKYNNGELCVKGSFSLLAHLNEIIRPVTDIDLVSLFSHNDPLVTLFKAMYESNDDLVYELSKLPKQTKTGIYKINIVATYGKIKHPISIDFQESSKTVYVKDYKRIDPVFSGESFFYIYTPTLEEYFAEKLCIVVESNKSDILNTRVKDFYDIYKLSGGKYDLDKLSYYFKKMIVDRNKINLDEVNTKHLDIKYLNMHQKTWDDMSKKYEFLDKNVNFLESFLFTKEFLDKEIVKLKK